MKENFYLYILLSNTGTLFTKTIEKYTNAPYNHASLSFNQNLSSLYSFGRKKAYNPLVGGFVTEDVYNGIFTYFPNTTCSIYKIPVSEESFYLIKEKLSYFLSNKSVFKYNLLGVLSIPFNIPFSRRNAYFCSEFIAYLFSESNINVFDKHYSLVTPNDFRSIYSAELIYEGLLYQNPHLESHILHFKKYRDHLPFNKYFYKIKNSNP